MKRTYQEFIEKNSLLSVIKSRRTVRKYTNKKIPQTAIIDILNAGQWAPSVHNFQPWHFTVITNKKVIRKIEDVMRKKQKNY